MERPPAKAPYRVRYRDFKLSKIAPVTRGEMNTLAGITQINELCSIILDLPVEFLLLKSRSSKFV